MNNVISWFEIPVAQMERAIAFYEPVMQVSLRRENMDDPGMGLAICQAIVDVHGGTISVHNRAQGGACFRVTLPQEIPPELEDFHEDM